MKREIGRNLKEGVLGLNVSVGIMVFIFGCTFFLMEESLYQSLAFITVGLLVVAGNIWLFISGNIKRAKR